MIANLKTPLRLLRAFCLAARHSSFKVAAERLALTPSAVSHQVRELEEQLGVTLFARRTRSVVLTPVGQQLFEELEPALEAVVAAVARASHGAGARPQLTVVMPPFFASEIFAPRLSQFHERHPHIDLQVDTSDPRPEQHRGYSDLSVILAAEPPSDVEYASVRLLPLELVAVAAPKVAARMAGKRGGRAFDDLTLIMHSSFRGDLWEKWLEIDLRRVQNVVEFDNMTAVLRATEQGGGVALMPARICGPLFESGALVRIEGLRLPSSDAYWLVARREDTVRPEVRAFTQWLGSQFPPEPAPV